MAAIRPPTAVIAADVTPTLANYLPVVQKPENTPTNTATPLPPTPTSTPQPPPADVRIVTILYNPAGDDVQGEYVQLQNFGGSTAVMTGWTLRDESSHVFTFPSGFSLAVNAAVRVWTKSGANTATDLYFGSAAAIWNNTGDTAFLRNGSGQTVDTCSYGGGGSTANCN
jgi:hypothetical protein